MKMVPCEFSLEGMYQANPWGGRDLVDRFGMPGPATGPVAEMWLVSDRPSDDRVSRIADGPLAGLSIRQLMENDAEAFLGWRPNDGKFPLLVKYFQVAPAQQLSVQVHPGANVAATFGDEPKPEAWLLLPGTLPDAYVYLGFKPGVTREQFQAALADGTVEQLLHRITVKPDDLLNVPPGRVHAPGGGCFLLEVQRNSNSTYRVFDYNRIDQRTGKLRELHVEKALAALNFADQTPQPQIPVQLVRDGRRMYRLLTTDLFTIDRSDGRGEHHEKTEGVVTIVANIHPTSQLTVAGAGETLTLPPLGIAVVPAAVGLFDLRGAGAPMDYALIRPVRPTA